MSLLLCSGVLAQDFVLTTPGTATWETVATADGSQTIFTISDDSVFDWGQMNLAGNDELVFNFVGGDTVTNYLNGAGTHLIAGDITANGNLGFFAPNGNLIITGSITAESVTLATLGVDAGLFAGGAGFTLSGASGGDVLVFGSLEATARDVTVAGQNVRIFSGASLDAPNGRVMVGGGSDIEILGAGERRLSQNSLAGTVFNEGSLRAPKIEVSAGAEVLNNGVIGEGNAQVFFGVGESGRISNESQGFIANDSIFDGLFNEVSAVIRPHIDGDAPGVVGDASLGIPALKRPDGSAVSDRRRITYSAPMSASADSMRDRKKEKIQTARNERKPVLASRSSFFGGVRGGTRTNR
ncbi:hypothetical protein [Haloferula sp. A504]|uniref:hypothetical protein n=1 Tax=Haloferula sp. A504 TaxID=3373601 RepID=UPI0031C99367|nr:hypothetical protein [Verrucomicrobiaceae bacterium E54]